MMNLQGNMFSRNGTPIMSFRVYDSGGNCVSEFTGTLEEWQNTIAPRLPRVTQGERETRLRVVK